MQTILDKVLSDSTYNQPKTSEEIALYELMNQELPSDELINEYKETFNSMTTKNSFLGVLTNPVQCDIDQAVSDVNDILETIPSKENVPEWVSQILTEVNDNLATYLDHSNRLVSNFPTISSIVQNEISNQLGSASDPKSVLGSNPCVAFADVMGSILKAGQDIIAEILSALQNLKDNLDAAAELIEQAVNKLLEAIAAAMTKIQEEVESIAKAMLSINKMNLASMLKFQNEDPCLQSILSSTLTSQAKNALGG